MSESFANITFSDGESIKATRENTTVYTHFGAGELYDHIFIRHTSDKGAYIWAQIPPDNPSYLELAPVAIKAGAETHINIREVAEGDLRAFGKAATRDIEEIPDWLPEA